MCTFLRVGLLRSEGIVSRGLEELSRCFLHNLLNAWNIFLVKATQTYFVAKVVWVGVVMGDECLSMNVDENIERRISSIHQFQDHRIFTIDSDSCLFFQHKKNSRNSGDEVNKG